MNVLSLFGGVECGRVALDKLNIVPNSYFSSEIDLNAVRIASNNYSDIIHLGNVCDVCASELPQIDLLFAGFPCTDFSMAGSRQGFYGVNSLEHYLHLKEQGHSFKGQSYLFWEVVRLIDELRPKYFLIENVIVSSKWRRLIDSALRVKPFYFNSVDFSPQNRKRLYWTNLDVPPIEDKSELLVNNILDSSVKYGWLDGEFVPRRVGTMLGGLLQPGQTTWGDSFRQVNRVYSTQGKSPALTTSNCAIYKIGDRYRRLTPLEQERLQGLPDNYTAGFSDNIRTKAIGNGWTVPVITHLLDSLI